MNILMVPDRQGYHYNAFEDQSKEAFPEEADSIEGRSTDSADRSSPSFTLSTIHSGAPMDGLDDAISKEGKSGLLSSIWRTNSRKIEPPRDENRDVNRPLSSKAQNDTNGGAASPKGSWLRKTKSVASKDIFSAHLPLTASPTQAPELEVAREPSASSRSGWALTGLLKRTKSDGARARKMNFEMKDKLSTGSTGTDTMPASGGSTSSIENGIAKESGRVNFGRGPSAEQTDSGGPAKDPRPPVSKLKARHQRSKSQGQVDNGGSSWMNRMMACNGPPQVTDDYELINTSKSSTILAHPMPALPNLGLMNAVPTPPVPSGEEPLMNFVPASQKKPPNPTNPPKLDQATEGNPKAEQGGNSAKGHPIIVPKREHGGSEEGGPEKGGRHGSAEASSPQVQAAQQSGGKGNSADSPDSVLATSNHNGEGLGPFSEERSTSLNASAEASDVQAAGTLSQDRNTTMTTIPAHSQEEAAADASVASLSKPGSELPNEAWTTSPDSQLHRRNAEEAIQRSTAQAVDGNSNKAASDGEAAPAAPAPVAERDRQVWEMSQRARAAAAASPPPPGLLSQSLAYIMAQLQKRDRQGGAINPFIAVYHAAQQAPDLINGAQQDIHEFWMTLKDLLNQDAGTRATIRLEDLFAGKTVLTLSCKKCANVVVQKEEFWDLTVSSTISGRPDRISVDNCLNEFCNPQAKDVKCSKCKEAEDASLAAAAEAKRLQPGSKVSLKETLGALFSNKKEGEGMTEKIAFEKLPPALVIHLKRTQCVPMEGGGCTYQKNDVPVHVNLGLKLGNYASEGLKEELKDDSVGPADYRLYACIFHIGTLPTRGHYTAACRIGPTDEDWYRFDDEKPPVKILNPVLRSGDKQKGGFLRLETVDMRDVCLLFYEKYHPTGSGSGE